MPEPPPKPGLPPGRGSYSLLTVNSVSESQQAPLRRKTSMGSFQKVGGDGEKGASCLCFFLFVPEEGRSVKSEEHLGVRPSIPGCCDGFE